MTDAVGDNGSTPTGQPAAEQAAHAADPAARAESLPETVKPGDMVPPAAAADQGASPDPLADIPDVDSEWQEKGPVFSDRDDASPIEEVPGDGENRPVATGDRRWYILKVQVNREDAIRDALQRKIAIAGLQDFFGELVVPDEKRTELKNGKKRVVRVKLYPGYLIVNMELNDDTWFVVRETSGIGDFTSSGGKPAPMSSADVEKILKKKDEKTDEAPKIKIGFKPSDRVRINDGMFANFEGSVETIDETNGRVTVMINIFGRSTPVELEYWQVESL